MSTTGIQGFDRSLHETHVWLNDISDAIEDRRRTMAYHALRGVLFALRDRLPPDEVFDLSAQLPLLIRGVFFEGYRPEGKPEKYGRDEFLERVRKELQAMGGGNAERMTRAVLGVLARHVEAGEVEDLRRGLPKQLRALWPEPTDVPSGESKPRTRGADNERRADDEARRADDEAVDEAGRESFPASDAPAWGGRDG